MGLILQIFGRHIPTPGFLGPKSPARVNINLLEPQPRFSFFKKSPAKQKSLLNPAPLAHKGIFAPQIKTLTGILRNRNLPTFKLDRPREATLKVLNENGEVHIVIILSDQDLIRWQAKETRLWHELSPKEQTRIKSHFSGQKIIHLDQNHTRYTIVARSVLVPNAPSLSIKSEDRVTREENARHVPLHLRRYLGHDSLEPEEIAFYGDRIFQNPPPKANIFGYKDGEKIQLPLAGKMRSFTVLRFHKLRRPYLEIHDDDHNIFIVPKGYVDRYNPPSWNKRLRGYAMAATLTGVVIIVPLASLILSLILLKGRLRYLTTFLNTEGKARWRWNGKKFDFVMHPGCHYAINLCDHDMEKNWGKDNRYYHLYRRLWGVLDKKDLTAILPGHPSEKLHLVWNSLIEAAHLEKYRSRHDEATTTEKISGVAQDLDDILKENDLNISERYLVKQLLQSYRTQFLQKEKFVDATVTPPPFVALTASGHIRLLQHHHILGAMDFGVPIAVAVLLNDRATLN